MFPFRSSKETPPIVPVVSMLTVPPGVASPVIGVAALLVFSIARPPSALRTIQVQPEPKLPVAAAMNLALSSSTEPKDESMAAWRSPPGEPLPPGTPVASEAEAVEALHTVYDPEIPVDIYELGLIYELEIAETGDVAVVMSLTAPGCPVAGEMPGQVAEAVAGVAGVGRVEVRLTWDPPWTPERMSEDARLALGMF